MSVVNVLQNKIVYRYEGLLIQPIERSENQENETQTVWVDTRTGNLYLFRWDDLTSKARNKIDGNRRNRRKGKLRF